MRLYLNYMRSLIATASLFSHERETEFQKICMPLYQSIHFCFSRGWQAEIGASVN